LSFRGAASAASPESIIPIGGYGFRAESQSSRPGMTKTNRQNHNANGLDP
jgi:hypothetical protein